MNSQNQVFSKKCLKCGHERSDSDAYPRHRCPNCNAGYLLTNTQVTKELKRTEEKIAKEEDSAKGAAEAMATVTGYFVLALFGGTFSFKNIHINFKDEPFLLVLAIFMYVGVVVPMGYWYYKKKIKIGKRRKKLTALKK